MTKIFSMIEAKDESKIHRLFRRSWTVRILKNTYAPITVTIFALLLCIACFYLFINAEQWILKEKVVTLAPWKFVRVAKASELTTEQYIRLVFGKDGKTAVAIAKAESGLRCDAQNVNKGTNSLDIGAMQINSVHLRKGWKVADLLDCHKNVDLAYEIYKGSGWGAWSTYKNGSYKKFLK